MCGIAVHFNSLGQATPLDLDLIHGFLTTAYWSPGVPREVVEKSIANSLPFGLFAPSGEQAAGSGS